MLSYSTLWFIINYNTYFRFRQFSGIHNSQGRVATYLECGETLKLNFVANTFGEVIIMGKSLCVLFFWLTV